MSQFIAKALILVVGLSAMMGCRNGGFSDQLNLERLVTSDVSGAELVQSRCSGCHAGSSDSGYSRISEARKTPEGWFMTIVRMEREGRVVLSDDERSAVVTYLANKQGLAPQEAANFRYAIEKTPNISENPGDPELAEMCGRCHSNARYSLQRRDSEDWKKLVHFHVAQFPSLEYQSMASDRPWLRLAESTFASRLGEKFPLDSKTWNDWINSPRIDISGQWRVMGRVPGRGKYYGTSIIKKVDEDSYRMSYRLEFADGTQWRGESRGHVYTGYEWRGQTSYKDELVREVYALSEDGSRFGGRWFLVDHEERGGSFSAVRMSAENSEIVGVEPAYLKLGESTRITIHGIGLNGSLKLGNGVDIKIIRRSDTEVVADIVARESAVPGSRVVQLGEAKSNVSFTLYDQLDFVRVVPENAIARIGGGKVEPVVAQFEAVGYMRGADGKAGTEDDIAIGHFPADWSHDNYDDWASELEDAKFAGKIDKDGVFYPADAGINPDRYIPTNNLGVLAISGTVIDGDKKVSGKSRLVVTVQRFLNPPIY